MYYFQIWKTKKKQNNSISNSRVINSQIGPTYFEPQRFLKTLKVDFSLLS